MVYDAKICFLPKKGIGKVGIDCQLFVKNVAGGGYESESGGYQDLVKPGLFTILLSVTLYLNAYL
ncbi:hypothetical protein GCM10011511_18950 [Puia dinghuensis]|uniref:Uncharacterized protein n=1 Tax=Puia dinghuensis TaxID=1792502 RepID=A0A8J2XSJ3_9BACT|nr:hypothetical protein GCM10011511_18950 [Puia dinghuensis]